MTTDARQRTRIAVENTRLIMGTSDVVEPFDGQSWEDALTETVVQAINTDLMVRIGGVSMFLGAWLDPGHWAEDWAEQAGVKYDGEFDAEAHVAGIIASAQET